MKLRLPTLWTRASTRHSIDQPDVQSPIDDSLPHELRRRVEAAQRQAVHQRARLEARFGPAVSWPRLSQTLTGPKHPHVCQSCGVEARPSVDESALPEPLDLAASDTLDVLLRRIARERDPAWGVYAWQESDSDDVPQPVVVVLCTDCSTRLIPSHPRVYRRVPQHAPFEGIMDLCLACAFREGVCCTHPQTQANGGPGLQLDYEPPISARVNAGRGRGRVVLLTVYPQPVRACSGRQPVQT